MACVICGGSATGKGTVVLHGKAVCPACLAELIREEGVGTPGLAAESLEERAGNGGPLGDEGAADVLQELNSELSRLGVAEADLGPDECTFVHPHGALFRVTDGYSSVVAPGDKLLERLRVLPDGAGLQATWWMLADLDL